VPQHINDPAFADAVVEAFRELHGTRARAHPARTKKRPADDFTRHHPRPKFRDMIARGEPIIGGGAGTGLSAKCEEAGGIDLIVIYNSGRYRMAGRGSLAGLMPYGDANAIVMEMAGEVLPVVKHTPVLAGRLRHRPVPADGCVPGRVEARRLFRACRTFPPWA
jgi:hypothetical protein